MTQEDFIAEFNCPPDRTGGHDEIVARLRERLQRLPHEQQFQVLFPIAVRSQCVGRFPVLDAARLLEELRPECPISCEDTVRALLLEWDPSIEEVPFYLAARFSAARVYQAIANLEPEVTEKEKVRLDGVAYWIHIYEGTWPPKKS